MSWGRTGSLRRDELHLVSAVQAARHVEGTPGAVWALYLMLAVVVGALTWASMAQVDMISRADARVVPDGREQVIASLEGGILRELLVKEGQQVTEGQALALLDPTRVEAQQAEGNARRLALQGQLARLQAEARVVFRYEIRNQDNLLINTGETTLVFLNRETNRPNRAPKGLIEKLKPYFEMG